MKEHLQGLHDYNDAKDAGQALMGQLAILEGVLSRTLYEQYGLNLDD